MDINPELYPFEHHFIDHNGVRQHYLDEGTSQEGNPCFIMVHGNPTWSFYYRNLVLGLRENYRCIVPDHVGCGFSDKPQDYNYQLEQHIENLEKIILYQNIESIILVVHDWGGAIGMGLARKHPEKIKGIVVLNTAAFLSPLIPFRISICKTRFPGTFINRALNGFARPALSMAVKKGKKLKGDIAKAFIAPYDNWNNRVAVDAFVKDIPLSKSHPSWQSLKNIEESLPTFRNTPMLICWGEQDFCFNLNFLKRWQKEFPKAEIHVYANAGHYVIEDEGEKILDEIINFSEPIQS